MIDYVAEMAKDFDKQMRWHREEMDKQMEWHQESMAETMEWHQESMAETMEWHRGQMAKALLHSWIMFGIGCASGVAVMIAAS